MSGAVKESPAGKAAEHKIAELERRLARLRRINTRLRIIQAIQSQRRLGERT